MITDRAPDFRAALPEGGRLLGLDVGTKTIGTALCDAGWTIATAAGLIRRSKFTRDLEALQALAKAQSVTGLVIGLPLNLDGTDSPRTQSVRAFTRNLEVPLGLPTVDWPEENPYSPEKAELGRLLYFDNRLSSDQSVSCASCHAPEKAFTDGSEVSLGIGRLLRCKPASRPAPKWQQIREQCSAVDRPRSSS